MSKSCGGACGGDATSAADTDIQAPSEVPGRWVSVYAVPKMDCPSEERMIRLALNGFEEIRALSFDLSNRRLKVVHDGEVEPVTSKLKTLGLAPRFRKPSLQIQRPSRPPSFRQLLLSKNPGPCAGCSASMHFCSWWK